jgi:FKBP-type peptidyl-prolyl cis-trans isomerase
MQITQQTENYFTIQQRTPPARPFRAPRSRITLLRIPVPMGVTRTVIKAGSGRTPKPNEVVIAHYVGTLANGSVFDSSRTRNKPLTFMIGIGSVIKGWDEGIMQMQLGEVATLVCSADFAYGDESPSEKIPAGSELTFEVELLQAGDEKAKGGCMVQ